MGVMLLTLFKSVNLTLEQWLPYKNTALVLILNLIVLNLHFQICCAGLGSVGATQLIQGS